MLRGLIAIKTALVRLLEWVVIVVLATLVLNVLWGVFSRFILQAPSRWTEEVATILLIWVALLGAAVAFGRNEHLGIDYLVRQFDPMARRMVAFVVQGIIAWFAIAVLIYGGYVLVSETLQVGQVTSALGILQGHVYLAVPISGVFILMFCLERMVELVLGRDEAVVDRPEVTSVTNHSVESPVDE